MKNTTVKNMIVKAIENSDLCKVTNSDTATVTWDEFIANNEAAARQIAEELTQGALEGSEKQIAYALDLITSAMLSRNRQEINKTVAVNAQAIEAKLEETKYAGDLIDFCKSLDSKLYTAQEEYKTELRAYCKPYTYEERQAKAAEFAATYLA